MRYIDNCMNWQERLSSDPKICHGALCVRGTRVMVTVVLDNLADGLSIERVLEEYPTLRREDVQAAVAYAAELVHERQGPPSSSAR